MTDHDTRTVLARIKNIVHDWVEAISQKTSPSLPKDRKSGEMKSFFDNRELDEDMQDLYSEDQESK